MKILYDEKYQELLVQQAKAQILYFLKNSIEFSIVVNMDSGITFQPALPEEITSGFREFTLFTLAGYTFQSAFVKDNVLVFEAGFGKDNIGTFVHVDIDRILQLVIGETPVFINVTASVAKIEKKDSFEIFASKNKNKKFFKKG